MALNKHIATIAFDRQVSGKGTLAATAKYGFGLRGGTVLNPGLVQENESLTTAGRFPASAFRSGFEPQFDLTSRVWPKSIGLLLYAFLGADAVTGAADPFTHTITPGAGPLYMTAFQRLDTEYHKLRDVKIEELSFSWDGASPLELGVKGLGCVGSYYQTSFAITNDESGDQCMYPAGGTFNLDTASGTPVLAAVSGGTITMTNHGDWVKLSKAVDPDDVWPGMVETVVDLKLIPADTTEWRKIITGTGAGTAASPNTTYGSFEVKFFSASAPEHSLDITATKLAFTGDYPDPDPAGGPVELEVTGTVFKPAAGAEITCVVKNDQAAAAYNGS